MRSAVRDEPRRFLIAVGVHSYASNDWQHLEYVPSEVEAIVKLLVSPEFRFSRVLEEESQRLGAVNEASARDRFLSSLSSFANSPDRRPNDHLVLYWTGHGEVDGEQLYFVLPTTEHVLVDGLQAQKVSDILLHAESNLGSVLLLFDVCFAGHAGLEVAGRLAALTRQRSLNRPPQISVICAAGPRHEAQQMVFSTTFVSAVRSATDPDKRLEPVVPLEEVRRRMAKLLEGSEQQIHSIIAETRGAEFPEFLRNPHHIPHWPRGVDVATARLFAAGRGVSAPDVSGWFFKGRKLVFADLCAWLDNPPAPGLCIVTGIIGSGKSAVLGRLYTLSRSDYRQEIPEDVLSQSAIPTVGSIDAAIVLAKMTLSEVISEVAVRLHVSASTQEQLISDLKARAQCPTLLFDALDEAGSPTRTQEFLEQLAQTACRVIVGTRKLPRAWKLIPQLMIDLDREPWTDPPAVKEYIADRLSKEIDSSAVGLPAEWARDIDATANAVATHSNCNFLLASLIVAALITDKSQDPLSGDWRFPHTVDQALDRLLDALNDDQPQVRDLLVPLAYAEGAGLPKGAFWPRIAERLSGRGDATLDLRKVFDRAPWFIVEDLDVGQSAYRPFHSALADMLKGNRTDATVHREFGLQLTSIVYSPGSDLEDRAYARNYLSRHMRKAEQWHELSELITTADWITSQSEQTPFHSSRYSTDVAENFAAALQANGRAVAEERPAPALGATVWRLLWQSAVVALAQDIPTQAWAYLCEYGGLPAELAVRTVAAIGDEQVRAARFAALAQSLRGEELDALLDFAEGITRHLEPGLEGSQSDGPVARYYDILRVALLGQDASRLAPRALQTAKRMPAYASSTILEVACPLLSNEELQAARNIIKEMGQGIGDRVARARATAAYVAACAQQSNQGSPVLDMPEPGEGLSYWFALAALLAVRKGGGAVEIADMTVPHALASCARAIDDPFDRIETLTEMVGTLPDLTAKDHRTALASYLWELRNAPSLDMRIRFAASAGEALPDPHGSRLLRWASAQMREIRRQSDRANMNFHHTPPRLAVALARRGDVRNAIDIVLRTERTPYFRPKALADVGRALARNSSGDLQVAAQTIAARARNKDSTDELQLLCSGAGLLSPDQHESIRQSLAGFVLSLGEAIAPVLCRVQAHLARHLHAGQIQALLDYFIRDVARLPEYQKVDLLTLFARICASANHAQVALSVLSAIDRGIFRTMAWRDVLAGASEASLSILLKALGSDHYAFHEVLDESNGTLINIVSRLPVEDVELIRSVLAAREWYRSDYRIRELTAALAIRAYELGSLDLTRELLPLAGNGLQVLEAVSRLASGSRRGFISLIEEAQKFSTPDCVALAQLLAGGQDEASSEAFVDAAVNQGMFRRWWKPSWIAECLAPAARQRFIKYAHQAVVSDVEPRSNDIEWMLPWLQVDQVDRLIEAARTCRDDYDREELLVLLLPRYFSLNGLPKAMALQASLRRGEFRSRSWAALWPHLSPAEQSAAFLRLTPAEPWSSDRDTGALRIIAPRLDRKLLAKAASWIVQTQSGDLASVLEPFVRAACGRTRNEAYEFWEAVLTAATRRPIGEAMSYLFQMIPVADHLGGKEGLTSIQWNLSRAAEQWP